MQTFIYRFEEGIIHSQKYTLCGSIVKWYEDGIHYAEVDYKEEDMDDYMRRHLWIITNDKTKIGETNA